MDYEQFEAVKTMFFSENKEVKFALHVEERFEE